METPSSVEISSSDDTNILQESSIRSHDTYQPIQVSLVDDRNLWSQFSKLGTEMVITKNGRQMFPGVKLKFENLNPYKFYKVYMELAPVDGMRYRFERNSWCPRGIIETSITSSWMEHPLSPAEGFKWMIKPVDFNTRLTNCFENSNGDNVWLRSMYKYRIIIHIEEGSDTTHRDLHKARTFPLVKTTFIAVTTYQNPEVKELKTATNIHAKGIRQKKLKRYQELYHGVKENLSKRTIADDVADSLKRPRMESDLSPTSIRRLFPPRDDSEMGKLPSTSPFLPNLNNFFPKPLDFMNRSDPFTTPMLSRYRRFETPVLNERIPVTTPLTVHCPSPYAALEHPSPYYTPLLLPMHPQNFPIIPPYSSPNFYPNKWPTYQSSCISSPCGSSALNICPSCREGFQNCISCAVSHSTQIFDHAAPSSSTETEVTSTFDNLTASIFHPSSRNSDSIVSSISAENVSDPTNGADNISSSVVEALNQVYS